ncbi:MAG: His/Gly/Thr/Pro-type tRNA ligase C-terminal domain-containing protein [Candidatus Gracilibacteria bacterium]|nr:His/Gly/Thr/Pro-type tRNA ligase C-terminal domain-containing protein [Candidatus Gracilibacteria bacterium]MDD2909114.1 His/Gly/Thr/Pro-type tRNA ligase C-terminal domain-containing protein [Candidatus Gracilibacteria bacterium]
MEQNKTKIKISSKQEDYSQWYLDVAKAGDLFEYSPTPGCIVFKPKAVTLWEKMKLEMNRDLMFLGVQNLYLPLLIPMSFFEKEKEHVEGFAPELAVVTIGGGNELDDKLAIRPTSETMFCEYFRGELQSYRDLPILTNQWCNIFRWEKRTRPFLRTAEFHWQEGHTLHETKVEANNFSLDILHNVYAKNLKEFMAIDGIAGQKSESEKFAGAEKTYTYEPMMSNGRALQICTSHLLGQGFMKQFDVSFQGREGVKEFPSYTSWGLSTRSIGGLISSHSDQKGLIIPPKMSEYSAVILPIFGKDNFEAVDNYIKDISKNLIGEFNTNGIPVKGEYFKAFVGANGSKIMVDYRDARFGEKITDFELSGYPVAIVVGQKEMEENLCTVISRITGEKIQVKVSEVSATVEDFFSKGQAQLFAASKARLENNIVPCYSIEEIGKAIEDSKFAIYEWDASDNIKDSKLEAEIKDKFKATTRCIPNEGQFKTIDDFELKRKDTIKVIIARAF